MGFTGLVYTMEILCFLKDQLQKPVGFLTIRLDYGTADTARPGDVATSAGEARDVQGLRQITSMFR
jgi:hypothetical protein